MKKIGVGDSELAACQVLLAGQLLVEPVEGLPRFSLEKSLKVSGVVGRKIGPKVLWISDVVKLSHSCTRTRCMLPLAGARPDSGFYSARY